MKICVLGLEGAAPEMLFTDERLANLRRLMELGAYGKLQSVVPPGAVPGWASLTSSQDPGSLGIYGLRNRAEYSYSASALATPPVIHGSALWDEVAAANKKSIVCAVPLAAFSLIPQPGNSHRPRPSRTRFARWWASMPRT